VFGNLKHFDTTKAVSLLINSVNLYLKSLYFKKKGSDILKLFKAKILDIWQLSTEACVAWVFIHHDNDLDFRRVGV
jgi:hypothetical protein